MSEASSNRLNKIKRKIEERILPFIYEECRHRLEISGVRASLPHLTWTRVIRIEEEGNTYPAGVMSYKENGRIYISEQPIRKRISRDIGDYRIIVYLVHTILHEFKHYIDYKDGLTREEYLDNREYYEEKAEEYADNNLRPIMDRPEYAEVHMKRIYRAFATELR